MLVDSHKNHFYYKNVERYKYKFYYKSGYIAETIAIGEYFEKKG